MATALRLFSSRGTAAVSMRDLGEAAGVTVPGLYYHFRSKAELIQAVYRARGLDRPLDIAELDDDLTVGRVEQRIVEQARREFARLIDDEDFLRLMQREAVLGDRDALEVGQTLGVRWRERWRVVLSGATDLDPRADVIAAADVITTFLWGLFVEYLNQRDRSVAERITGLAALVSPSLGRPDRGR